MPGEKKNKNKINKNKDEKKRTRDNAPAQENKHERSLWAGVPMGFLTQGALISRDIKRKRKRDGCDDFKDFTLRRYVKLQ